MRLINLRSIENQLYHCYRSLAMDSPNINLSEYMLNQTYAALASIRSQKFRNNRRRKLKSKLTK